MHIHHTHRELLHQCLREAIDRQLPSEVILRLQWIEDFVAHGSVSGTCRRFGIARTTFYRWLHRFDPSHLLALQDVSRNFSCGAGSSAASVQKNVDVFRNKNVCDASHDGASIVCAVLRIFWSRCKTAVITASIIVNLVMLLAMLAIARWETAKADLLDLEHTQPYQAPASPSAPDSVPLL